MFDVVLSLFFTNVCSLPHFEIKIGTVEHYVQFYTETNYLGDILMIGFFILRLKNARSLD